MNPSPICAVCGDEITDLRGAWEEATDDFWCISCIAHWELEYEEDWATGKPLKRK